MRRQEQDARHVDVDVTIEHETVLAYMVSDGAREAWIPKSQLIDFDHDAVTVIPSQAMTITIPEWLAKAKGLI